MRLLPERRSLFRRVDRLAELDDELQKANVAGQHVHIGANPRKRQTGKAEDVALARSLFADLDKMTTAEGLRRVADAGSRSCRPAASFNNLGCARSRGTLVIKGG